VLRFVPGLLLRVAEALFLPELLFLVVEVLFLLVDFLPLEALLVRPEPLFFPPPDCLFTVAQARLSASLADAPLFLYPSSIFSAWRFCLSVYFDLSPLGMLISP